MQKSNEYFLYFPNGFTDKFLKSLTVFPNIQNVEIYKFSSLKPSSLDRLFKLFKSDFSSVNINESNIQLISLEIQINSDTRLINKNGQVYSIDLNSYDLLEFIDNKLQNNAYLITQTNQQFYAIKSIIPKIHSKSSKGENIIFHIKEDLLGANKWDSLSSLVQILNKSTNWLVLRNFEELTDSYLFKKGDDIDILCQDLEYFTAVMNAKRRFGGRCSYYVSVNNQNIPLDIRFVGDKYIDPLWASDMLRTKEFRQFIPTPSKYNYFFSLLYHSKLQKRAVKKIYIQRLDDLATGINFKNLPKRFVLNDIICANLLNGFLSSNSYKYTFTDDAVRNESFLNYIKFKEINDPLNNWRILIKKTPKVIFKKVILRIRGIFTNKPNFPKIYFF
jgi:hypothetical protein